MKLVITSPIATGNGAYIVHRLLESCIPGYEVIPFNPYRTLFPPFLSQVCRGRRADMVHTTPDYAIFHARKDAPLVVTFHNYVLDRFMGRYSSVLQNIHYQTDLKLFTKLAVRKATAVTAVSRFTAALVEKEMKLSSSSVRVIYNGVDHSLFTPSPTRNNTTKKNITVLFSGNLSLRKGARWLAPIAERLDRNIAIHYTSGLQPSDMLPDHPQLYCLGGVPYEKMPALYQNADILLFPTVREGFGLAAAEAMACGLPVVASDCSALPELIDEGRGGFLCPVGDVDAFAEKINLLAGNPRLRHEMGEYNRDKVERMFTLKRMTAQYQALFEEVLSK